MEALKKTKYDEISEEINKAIRMNQPDFIDDVSFRRIKKKIDLLEKSNAGEAWFCLMKLHGGKGNKKDFLHYQKISEQQYNFFSPSNLRDYAAGFFNVGLIFSALDYAREAYKIEKIPELLHFISLLAYDSGHFLESYGYLVELTEMSNDSALFEEWMQSPAIMVNFMKKNALQDSDVASVFKIVEDVLQANNLIIVSASKFIEREDDDEYLAVDCKIKTTPKNASYMNLALANQLSKSINPNVFGKISYSFIGIENETN